ncbi:MAG TPA: DUF418 domain-containing protein [Acidimicrobiia bacterium]|nr:DUF418 domain-containing protein [Acidimicrobiia bacterium]
MTTPTLSEERITTLDAIRGVAVLGLLVMNAVSYGLEPGAYFNLDVQGSVTWLDWAIGGFGEIFVDQKFMGLFSMLFGAGIVLFAERAGAKGRRPVLFSLWRNTVLLGIGLLHAALWDGDVLTVYALCSPVVLAVRKCSPRTLFVIGTGFVLLSALAAVVVQGDVGPAGAELGTYWFLEGEISDSVELFELIDFFSRSLGMMLIGVGLYRMGILSGSRPPAFYRRMAAWGLGLGLPLAAFGMGFVAVNGFSPGVALSSQAPNTLGTIPVALGYVRLIIVWNQSRPTVMHERVRAVGRMALTNYLSQTVLGVLIPASLDATSLTRSGIFVFVVSVWALQLIWSKWWLERFRYGPAEWAWRSVTYWSPQPMRIIA